MKRELLIIGAGPAGMSAAATAAELGIDTVLIDEQPQAGGQIYRNVGQTPAHLEAILGPDYLKGKALVDRLTTGPGATVEQRFQTSVWNLTPELAVYVRHREQTAVVAAKQIIAATGAMERPTPVDGWTLPGVMQAGAAQIALKSGGAVPRGRIVLAGAGPLLLLVAVQLIAAGADVRAVVETGDSNTTSAFLSHGLGFLQQPEYVLKGLKLLARLKASKVAMFKRATLLGVTGSTYAEGVRFAVAGQEQTIAADTVLLHHGVVPNQQITRLLGIEHRWREDQLAWQVVSDDYGQTSLPGFRVAGDGATIVGAVAAAASGALAALGAAVALGRLSESARDARAQPYRATLAKHRRARPFLDALYRPSNRVTNPPDAVIVCRCEEVSAGTIRQMADIGCAGPNQTKFFSRCGMGPCQGRMCGGVVTQILASRRGVSPEQIGAYNVRAPLKPLPLSALAALDDEATE